MTRPDNIPLYLMPLNKGDENLFKFQTVYTTARPILSINYIRLSTEGPPFISLNISVIFKFYGLIINAVHDKNFHFRIIHGGISPV